MDTHTAVIIGAGPAGLTTAMQLSRQGIDSLIFEKKKIGGLLLNANLVENYPGFVEGIPGPELVDLFQRQADRIGVNVVREEVRSAAYEQELFWVKTNKREVKSKFLVAATGTKARTLEQNIFDEGFNDVVFTDVYPLINKKNKKIIIVGAGDAALDYALNLADHNHVLLLNRGTEIKGLPLLWDRVQNKKSIEYHPGREISRVEEGESGRIRVTAGDGPSVKTYQCDYLLTAIGRDPEMGFISSGFSKVVDELRVKKRLYFIGDLCNGSFRQTALAVGDGIRAAMQIGQILEKEDK